MKGRYNDVIEIGGGLGWLVISCKCALCWLLSSALSEAREPLPNHNGFCCFL